MFDLEAAVRAREIRHISDVDAFRWLVALGDDGDPLSWTVECAGERLRPVTDTGHLFESLHYERRTAVCAWPHDHGSEPLWITTPDGRTVTFA